jgi:serine/threonine-protein kinase
MADVDQRQVNPVPGDVLAGKYRVERVLGAGGMGIVVAAHHLQLDEKVALKFLLPNALLNPEAVQRFTREARAAAKIKNEHVARVTDVGELENGSPYMVMEYLEGRDLSSWLGTRGALPVELAADFVLQACEALAEAHVLGIVHRDLKPANLFCLERPDGSVCIKVLDFGISKVLGADGVEAASAMTKTTAFLGSPLYMSPEQLQHSRGVDTRTDIWALGVILYELIAGRVPFDAQVVTELIIKIATQPSPPLRQVRPDAPLALETLLARCLEKDRDLRFQTVGELALALREFASPRGRISVEGIVGTLGRAGGASRPSNLASSGSQAGSAGLTQSAWGDSRVRSGSGRPMAVGILAAVAVAGIGMLVLRRATPTTAVVVASPPASAASPAPSSATASTATSAQSAGTPASVDSAPATPAPPVVAPSKSAPQTPPHHGGSAISSPATSSSVTSAPKPSCDPPFTLDDQGRKRFKPECFLQK